jgi:hypothetical protein
MSKAKEIGDTKRQGNGAVVALVIGLLWGAAIGGTWYFYRENDSTGGIASFFGRFHIALVHLPIGLLLVLPLMEMVGWTRWGKKVREAVPFVLWAAVLSAVSATFLGYLMMHADDTAGVLMTRHMWTGLAVGVFSILALIFKLTKIGPLYAITLIGAVVSTAAAGHFGGAMVHGKEYLTDGAPERIKPLMKIGLATGDDAPGILTEVKDALATAFTGKVKVDDAGAGEVVDGAAGDAATAVSVADGDENDGAEGEPSLEEQRVFAAFVQPILEGKCTGCHSEEKIKGKLRLDSHEMIMAGAEGTDYPTVISGDADESEMIARVLMPEDDDLFMPPDGKDKLTEAEVAVLKWWISEGAKEEGSVADLKADETMLSTLAAVSELLVSGKEVEIVIDAAPAGVWPTLSAGEQEARLDAVLAAAASGGYAVLPISAEDDRLRVSAVNASAIFSDVHLADLEPVAERVVWLDIGRTQVTDAGMEAIGGMRNIERLHLEQTAITDSGIRYLAGLSNLEYLNLYGTDVTAAIFEPLANLRNLRKLFLWETNVDHDAALQFQREMSLEVNTGWEVAAEAPKDESAGSDEQATESLPEEKPAPAPEEKKPDPAKPEAAKSAEKVKKNSAAALAPASKPTPSDNNAPVESPKTPADEPAQPDAA